MLFLRERSKCLPKLSNTPHVFFLPVLKFDRYIIIDFIFCHIMLRSPFLPGFIAECTKKRSLTSVMLRVVIKPSRHQLSCHVMLSDTLERNHTNVTSVKRLSSDMMISSDITAFTLVSLTTCNAILLVSFKFNDTSING